ncbi:MAG: hypothetical protein LC623_08850 [Halobacteriales archaeon]|nr:hypothetical protein [Halobacteriales archaeon]
MPHIGRQPYWIPVTAGDRVLVAIFNTLYTISYAPIMLLNHFLGWSRINWVVLDLLVVPSKLMQVTSNLGGSRGKAWGRKANALGHTEFVCRLCPAARQATRVVDGSGICAWNRAWNQGDFSIPPDFGPKNYVRQFTGKTDLTKFQSLSRTEPAQLGRGRKHLPTWALWTISLTFWTLLVGSLLVLAT